MPGSRRAELVGTCDVLLEKDAYFGSDWKDWLLEQEVSIIEITLA
jgi:hypothetical protein